MQSLVMHTLHTYPFGLTSYTLFYLKWDLICGKILQHTLEHERLSLEVFANILPDQNSIVFCILYLPSSIIWAAFAPK